MAFSKAHRFHERDAHYSLICRAVGHPARLEILRQLFENGPCSVKELSVGKPISKPSISQHLDILRKMQIVQCDQQYPTVIYWLNTDLPNTYATVVQLIQQAGRHFDQQHSLEFVEIGRAFKAFAGGI